MAKVIGEARVVGSRVVYLVRAEDPISGIIGDGGGTELLAEFLAAGWRLGSKLEKDGDTAVILETSAA